jgi:signal transduction histidine kinase
VIAFRLPPPLAFRRSTWRRGLVPWVCHSYVPVSGADDDEPAGADIVRAALNALWLRGLRTPAPWRYGVGVFVASVASLARIALNPWWGTGFLPYIFFFPATLFTALFGGLGPAWVGIVICSIMTAVWLLPPGGSLPVSSPLDLVGLAVYIVVDGIVAWIGAAHRTLIDQRERQAVELETANRAKDDFLAVLSHELRTPLTTIIAGLRVLRRIGGSDERTSHTREAIERQADHLARLVDDLLDLKKVEAGVVVLERQPCDLADAVNGSITMLEEASRFKAHTLSVDAESVWINGDVTRLQQVVVNLLGNAIKYTPAGGSIRVSVNREEEDAVLRVQDTGTGISPDLLPRMFDLFVQGDAGSGHVRSGLGIGLAVVRLLVEGHGGTVQASSDGPGKGSTFTVRLPRVPEPSE